MRTQNLSLIFAIAQNGVIGRGGHLPWSFSEDRAHFVKTTMGHVVVMGRRTWEEQGEPLEGRTNIVVSSSFTPPEGVLCVPRLDEALAVAWRQDDEPFVIGGVRLFEEALPLATRVLVTDVPGDYEGDALLHFDRRPFRETASRSGERGLVFRTFEPDLREVGARDGAAASLLASYFDELRIRIPGFSPPLVDDAGDVVILAYEGDRPVACGTLRPHAPDTLLITRMFVVADARGRGQARRILRALERKALSLGSDRIVLDTAESLTEAIRLYERSGYRAIPRFNDNPVAARWFEKRLPKD